MNRRTQTLTMIGAIAVIVSVLGISLIQADNADAVTYAELSNGTWEVEDGVLTVTANAEHSTMQNWSWTDTRAPWCSPETPAFTSVVIVNYDYVGMQSFRQCQMTSLDLNGATDIGPFAFWGCTSLTDVTGDQVKTTTSASFTGCTGLTELNFPALTSIGDYSFAGCTSLKKVTTDTITSISADAFHNCTALKTISKDPSVNGVIDLDSVQYVAARAFMGCTGIEAVSCNSATALGDQAFNGCTSLAAIECPLVNTIGTWALNSTAIVTLDLPNLTTANNNFLAYCTKLTEVNIPLITVIPSTNFIYCTALEKVTCGKLTTIGNSAFGNCYALKTISTDGSAANLINLKDCTTIYESAFASCTSMKTVNCDSLKFMETKVFYKCTGLETVYCNSLESVGVSVFDGCTGLETLIIGTSGNGHLTAVMDSAFKNCSSLTTIRCQDGTDGTVNLNNLAAINHQSFSGCTSITKVNCNDATTVGGGALSYCYNLTTVECRSLTDVSASAFEKDTGLVTLTGNNLKTLGTSAFSGCSKLKTVGTTANVVSIPDVTVLSEACFFGCAEVENIIYGNITSIEAHALQNCIVLNTLGPTGTEQGRVNLGSVESIGSYGLYDSLSGLTELSFPNTLKTLEMNAVRLANVKECCIPSSVTSISGYGLTTTVSGGVVLYFDYLDNVQMSANSIYVPNSVVTIYYGESCNVTPVNSYITSYSNSKTLHPVGEVSIMIAGDNAHVPSFSSIRSIDGSKVVLPYMTKSNITYTLEFGIIDSNNTSNTEAWGLLKSSYEKLSTSVLDEKYPESGTREKYASSGETVTIHLPKTVGDSSHWYCNFIAVPDALYTYTLHPKLELMVTDAAASATFTYDHAMWTKNGTGTGYASLVGSFYYGSTLILPMADALGKTYETYTSATCRDVLAMGAEFKVGIWETSLDTKPMDNSVMMYWMQNDKTDGIYTSGTQLSGTDVALPSQDPVWKGYTFKEWNTNINGTGTTVDADYKIPYVNTKVYAIWVAKEYTVTVNWNGGASGAAIPVHGPYTLNIDTDGKLLLTDADHSGSSKRTAVFNPNAQMEGYEYSQYTLNGAHLIDGEIVGYTSDITLWLYLNEITYTLNFTYTEQNGAAVSPNTVATIIGGESANTVKYSQIAGARVSVPVKAEYSLKSASVGERTLIISADYITLSYGLFNGEKAQTMTFVFGLGEYRVVFDYNNGTGEKVTYGSVTKTDGEIFFSNPEAGGITKTGYTFSAWVASKGEVTVTAEAGESLKLTDDMIATSTNNTITFVAQWVSNEYDIVYDPNGPDTAVPGTVIKTDGTWTLPDPGEYAGYKFLGWTFVKNGTVVGMNGDRVALTQEIVNSYASDGRITMYAKWSAYEYTVSFGANGGSGTTPLPKQYVKIDGPFILPSHGNYVKSYCTFVGWKVDGIDRIYEENEQLTISKELAAIGDGNGQKITFKMVWVSSDYAVQYNLNGGKGSLPVDNNTYNLNDPFTIQDGTGLTRAGYYFLGWHYNAEATQIYTATTFDSNLASSAEDNDKILILYAVWGELSYNINYNYAGGVAGRLAPDSAFYGTDVEISYPEYVGYKFAGWTAAGLTEDAQYVYGSGHIAWRDGTQPALSVLFKNLSSEYHGTVTLTATWAKATYSVNYDLNGGEGTITVNDSTGQVGGPFVFATTDAQQAGYSFAGWSLDGNTVLKEDIFTESMAKAANTNMVVTLYAAWTPESYNIAYRYDPADSYIVLKAFYGAKTAIDLPAKTGNTFAGWSVTGQNLNTAGYSRDGTVWYSWATESDIVNGTYFRNLSTVKDSTVYLTANWNLDEYKLSYNANGGAGTPPKDTRVYQIGDALSLASLESLRGTYGNKIIVGWALDPGMSVALSIDTFSEGLAERADSMNTVTLYAVWVEGSYTVSVDLGGAVASAVPSGWEQDEDGHYFKLVDYGTDVGDVMSDWDRITLSLDGYKFVGWNYPINKVVTNIDVTASFDKIVNSLLYVFAAVIAAVLVGALLYARRER